MIKNVTELSEFTAACFRLVPTMHAMTSDRAGRATLITKNMTNGENLINYHVYLYETMLFDLLPLQCEQGNKFR